MKRILFFLITLAYSVFMQAQNVAINNDGSAANASALLDVKSTTKGLLIPRMASSERTAIAAVKGLMVFDNTTSSFWFYNGSAWGELAGGASTPWLLNGTNIYNTNTGNVGIGTSSPTYDLHIRRTNPSIGFYDEDDAHPSGTIEGDSTNLVINAHRKPLGIANKTAGDIILQVNQTSPLGITASPGNVGIGTTSPNAKLHIGGSGNVMIGDGTPATKFHIKGTSGELIRLEATTPQINLVSDAGDFGFINLTGSDIKIGTLSSNNIGKFIVRTNGYDRMQVDENGDVAIGTNIPATGYRLSVNGKAIFSELKVQLPGNWPDYVFSPGYSRLSIYELEKFLHKHKHLPGIPSAKQVENNGIEVGDMQRLAMEKIEELTLYIIELKKEIDALKTTKN